MTPDNWNFLANLLGTPEPAEPPAEKETKEQAAIDHADADTASESSQDDSAAIAEVDADRDQVERSAERLPAADEVIQALTSVTAPSLPGFGVREADPALEELAGVAESDEPDAEELLGRLDAAEVDIPAAVAPQLEDESDTLDEAWSELANELGVDPEAAPPPRPSAASSIVSRAQSRSSKGEQQPKEKKRDRSFGVGLGIDLGPEPEEESSEEAEFLDDAEFTGELETTIAFDDDLDDDEVIEVESYRRPADTEGRSSRDDQQGRHRGPRRGRTGRRGQRQRMTDDDLDLKPSGDDLDDFASSVDLDDDLRDEEVRDQQPRRRRSRRPAEDASDTRSRDADRLATNEFDEDEDDAFGADLLTEESSSREDADDQDRPRRRRRRGRRGRSSSSREEPTIRDDDKPADDDFDDDQLDEVASFDDDHEDDEEAEAIRRGRRGRRGGRGRRDDADVPKATDADEDEGPRRRQSVPTWQETVNLFVDANVVNHKKPRERGDRGGAAGGRGRRRRGGGN